ncbi:MAG TPA: hypothetical protein VHI10_13940, partial [Mycobacterium sp.]|nr:hypothetical protein [Mycobacterium sp.]
GIFDAAEDTVEWRVEAAGSAINCIVRVELSGAGSPAGITVRLQSGAIVGSGELDAEGSATFPVQDAQGELVMQTAAWDHDWRPTAVTIGADVDESRQTRERIRAFARSRLDRPASDAFLAEILAAESDY